MSSSSKLPTHQTQSAGRLSPKIPLRDKELEVCEEITVNQKFEPLTHTKHNRSPHSHQEFPFEIKSWKFAKNNCQPKV